MGKPAGRGSGFTLPLDRPGVAVTGIDLSPHILETDSARVRRLGLGNVRGLTLVARTALPLAGPVTLPEFRRG